MIKFYLFCCYLLLLMKQTMQTIKAMKKIQPMTTPAMSPPEEAVYS